MKKLRKKGLRAKVIGINKKNAKNRNAQLDTRTLVRKPERCKDMDRSGHHKSRFSI